MKFIQRNCHWFQQQFPKSPASLFEGLPIKIGKCCSYPCFQLIFGVQNFFDLMLKYASPHNNQGDCNLGS